MTFLHFLAGLLAPKALAMPDLQGIIDIVGQGLPGAGDFVPTSIAGGTGGFNGIMVAIAEKVRPLLGVTAMVLIAFAGARMIIGQDDEAREKAKTLLIECVSGLILAYLIPPFINALYGATGEVPQGNIQGGASILNQTMYTVINWSLGLVAVAAVVTIIITGLLALSKATSEEGMAELRRAIFAIAGGIALILLRQVLALTMGLVPNATLLPGTAEPSALLASIVYTVDFFLAWVTLAAVAVVIYAGIRMVLSMGNEEQMTKAKELIIRALIGLAIIIVSFALVHFVVYAIV